MRVLHFTDSDPSVTPGSFTATVALGNPGNTTLTSAANPGNVAIVSDTTSADFASSVFGFDVDLTYAYTEAFGGASGYPAGTFSVTVVNNATPSDTTTQSTALGAFSVADVPLSNAKVALRSLNEGASTGLVTVATFQDPGNPSNIVQSDYRATIYWGDGSLPDSLTSANFVYAGGGVWDVQDSHTYKEAGSYMISATVYDGPGNSTTASSLATVAEMPLTAIATPNLVSTTGPGAAMAGNITAGAFDGQRDGGRLHRPRYRCESSDRLQRHDQLGRRSNKRRHRLRGRRVQYRS